MAFGTWCIHNSATTEDATLSHQGHQRKIKAKHTEMHPLAKWALAKCPGFVLSHSLTSLVPPAGEVLPRPGQILPISPTSWNNHCKGLSATGSIQHFFFFFFLFWVNIFIQDGKYTTRSGTGVKAASWYIWALGDYDFIYTFSTCDARNFMLMFHNLRHGSSLFVVLCPGENTGSWTKLQDTDTLMMSRKRQNNQIDKKYIYGYNKGI